MKNDLTNYTISQNRDAVEEYSAQFEYKEFLKFLDKFPGESRMLEIFLACVLYEVFRWFCPYEGMAKDGIS